MILKVRNMLASWKSKLLSKTGNVILINSTINAIPSYISSSILLPKALTKCINQVANNFFWGNNNQGSSIIHLMAWRKLNAPTKFGGIGFRDSEFSNIIALTKLAWKIHIHNDNNLMSSIFNNKNSSGDSLRAFSKGSHVWQNIEKF